MAGKQDVAETFRQLLNREKEKIVESYAKYDINDSEELIRYEKGDTICPGLAESLGKSREFLDKMLEKPTFATLSNQSTEEKF